MNHPMLALGGPEVSLQVHRPPTDVRIITNDLIDFKTESGKLNSNGLSACHGICWFVKMACKRL